MADKKKILKAGEQVFDLTKGKERLAARKMFTEEILPEILAKAQKEGSLPETTRKASKIAEKLDLNIDEVISKRAEPDIKQFASKKGIRKEVQELAQEISKAKAAGKDVSKLKSTLKFTSRLDRIKKAAADLGITKKFAGTAGKFVSRTPLGFAADVAAGDDPRKAAMNNIMASMATMAGKAGGAVTMALTPSSIGKEKGDPEKQFIEEQMRRSALERAKRK